MNGFISLVHNFTVINNYYSIYTQGGKRKLLKMYNFHEKHECGKITKIETFESL